MALREVLGGQVVGGLGLCGCDLYSVLPAHGDRLHFVAIEVQRAEIVVRSGGDFCFGERPPLAGICRLSTLS